MWRLLLGAAAALRSAAAVRVGNASGWPSVVPQHPVPETLGWSEYKRTFAKAYIDGADEAMRRAAFEENVRLIRQLNADHARPWSTRRWTCPLPGSRVVEEGGETLPARSEEHTS